VLTRDGRYLLLTLYNRTGTGTGIIPNVSAPLVASGASIADALSSPPTGICSAPSPPEPVANPAAEAGQ